jgi:hypothetical protein
METLSKLSAISGLVYCVGETLTIVYGCTCTVASLLTSGIGFSCESFAFTCTTDRFDEPGASVLTTMPSRVLLPLTPGVLGWRVAEIIA